MSGVTPTTSPAFDKPTVWTMTARDALRLIVRLRKRRRPAPLSSCSFEEAASGNTVGRVLEMPDGNPLVSVEVDARLRVALGLLDDDGFEDLADRDWRLYRWAAELLSVLGALWWAVDRGERVSKEIMKEIEEKEER